MSIARAEDTIVDRKTNKNNLKKLPLTPSNLPGLEDTAKGFSDFNLSISNVD